MSANNPYFPNISFYTEPITDNDQFMLFPIVNNNRHSGFSIDGLPRKITAADFLTYVEENGTFTASAAIEVKDEGTSIGTVFDTFNFVGPLIAATDGGSDEATITVTGTLMSSFTDVSTEFYNTIAGIFFGSTVPWIGNEPSESSGINWLANFNASTFVMTWDPVDGIFRPVNAFDIVNYLSGASENIYNTNDSFTSSRIADLADKNVSFYTTSGWTQDQLRFEMNSSATASSNYIRLNGHRLRPMETSAGDIQLGYFNAADGVSRDIDIKFYTGGDTTVNGFEGDARIFRGSGANGIFEIANAGTGGIRFQAGAAMSGVTNEFRLADGGALTASEYGSGTFTGTATYALQVDASGNIIEGALGGGGSNTNFAEDDLTADADRSHDFAQFDLLIDNVTDLTLNAEDNVYIRANESLNSNTFLRGFGTATQSTWFLRAHDGTDGCTIQVVADDSGGTTQIELTTGTTPAGPIFLQSTYVAIQAASQSTPTPVRFETGNSLGSTRYTSIAAHPTLATAYALVLPDAQGAANSFIQNDGSGNLDFITFINGLEDLTDPGGDRVMFWDDSAGAMAWLTASTGLTITGNNITVDNQEVVWPVSCSAVATDLTTGTAKATFRMPYSATLNGVRASVATAPTGSTIIVDINESGTTVLSTKLTIDATEKTSTTAATSAVISDPSLANDAEITIDIDQIGSTVAGQELVVYLYFTRN